jgi:hypothetical protein
MPKRSQPQAADSEPQENPIQRPPIPTPVHKTIDVSAASLARNGVSVAASSITTFL